MCRPNKVPLVGYEGQRAEARGERGGTSEREHSEPPLKLRDSASLCFKRSASRKYKEARCAPISVVPPRLFRSAQQAAPPIPGGEIKFAGRHYSSGLLGQALKPGAGRLWPPRG